MVNTSRSRGPGRPGPVLLTLPPELRSVRAARVFVAERCEDAQLSAERCDDALLLTSELVTNAVLHGRSEVALEVEVEDDHVRVSIVDENSRHPVPVEEDADALDGRGLALVDALARRWGVEDRPLGKAVWFELARP
jgi:anti-sigma regulatory factor (Ser/Thr protein kinase)